MTAQLIADVLLAGFVFTAGMWDAESRRIPNWLTLGGLAAALAFQALNAGTSGLLRGLSGAGLAFSIYLLLWLLRAVGGGDVKLMAAVGAFAGPLRWVYVFAVSAILGGIIALVLLIATRRLKRTLWNVGFILMEFWHFRSPYLGRAELDVASPQAVTLPHGVTVALGCLGVLAAGWK